MTSTASPLPRSVVAGIAGGISIVLIIVGAVIVRGPLDEQPTTEAKPGRGRAAQGRVSPSASPASATAAQAGATAGSSPGAAPSSVPADAREARVKFSRDAQSGRFKEAVTSLTQMLEIDPEAPKDSDIRSDVLELAMRVMLLPGSEPDAVFEQIASHMGTTGADILYELITTRGGSRAARRAEEMLKDEEVRAKGSPALRVAYEMRAARSCEEKVALLDRAKSDGDGRTLGMLQTLNKSCSRQRGDCCLRDDPKFREAVEAIRSRIE